MWLIILCTILAAGTSFLVSSNMTPVYSSTAQMLVHQAPTSTTSDYTALLTSERLARTYAQMVTGRSVMEQVIAQLELADSPDGLASRVSVELVRDTQLINLSAEDTNPALAAQIANTTAEVFIAQNQALQEERYAESLASMQEQIDSLSALIEETQADIDALGEPEEAQEQPERSRLDTILAGYRNTYSTLVQNYEQMRLTAMQSTDNVVILQEATVRSSPIRPRISMNTALAGVVGAMLAVGAAFLIEYLDDTVKTPDDIVQVAGLETLGIVNRMPQDDGELVTLNEPLSPVSEAFRVLRTNIRFSSVDRQIRTLLVTSPGPLEGKSLTVANLAVTMAQAGLKVVVVDADLRRPRQHRIFDIHPRGGLAQSLLEGLANGRLQTVGGTSLAVLPVGERPPNPVELLGSQRMQDLLAQLLQQVDMVLIDTPPMLPVADAAVLAPHIDGVLLVVHAGKTRRQALRQAVEGLRQVGANLIGVSLNSVPRRGGGYYYNYAYYDRYYGEGEQDGKRRRRKKSRRSSRRRSRRERPTRRRFSLFRRRPSPSIPSPAPRAVGTPAYSPSRWGKWVAEEDAWRET
jgi:non-specific protein-tyrosine kinase